ncbi:PPK2 family polyphosphate kinase [Aedoeadaptatus nemausensis]|nr:PPK2 family polyphosphate kinase [Peptoniphilus nemausensis]
MKLKDFMISGEDVHLADFDRRLVGSERDEDIKESLYKEEVPTLVKWHEKLHAQGTHGIVVVLQALDAAGKDEIIRYIFSNLLPQGLKHTSFGKPSEEETKHDYLWRMAKAMPERGQIGILNRSYYEDILSPKINDILDDEPIPEDVIKDDIWEKRYRQINDYERYLTENGFPVVKFFFNMSKETQKERLLERLTDPEKNHEFSFSDLDDRGHWDEYQEVFEEMLDNTSTDIAPWYVLPADNPWLARKIASQALIKVMEEIHPDYPSFAKEEEEDVEKAIDALKNDEI